MGQYRAKRLIRQGGCGAVRLASPRARPAHEVRDLCFLLIFDLDQMHFKTTGLLPA